MKITRVIPQSQRRPSYAKRLMYDTVRGVMRVRKWPRKRGTPTATKQLFWIDWFRQANYLAKYVDAATARAAIELTKGSSMYPRDVIMKAMRGRLLHFVDQNGWRWFSVAAIGDISNSLDILGQSVGNLLVRATDRWRPAVEGTPGDVLTQQAAGSPPKFAPAAGGGGVVQQELPGTPIIADGTKTEYDLDVTAYASLAIGIDNAALASAGYPYIRVSVDGGVTYKAGATDYAWVHVSASSHGAGTTSAFIAGFFASTTGHYASLVITGLRTKRVFANGAGGRAGSNARTSNQFTRFDGPVTHIRIRNSVGAIYNSGTIYVVGTVKG